MPRRKSMQRVANPVDDDLATLGPMLADRLAIDAEEKSRFMRMENGHCAALDTSQGQFRCTIYEQRPLICRIYKLHGKQSLCPPRLRPLSVLEEQLPPSLE